MKVIVLVEKNPFANPGAASNRLLGLLRGIAKQDKQVELLITGGYASLEERQVYGKNGIKNQLKYNYVLKSIFESIWQKRLKEFILDFFIWFLIRRSVLNKIKDNGEDDLIIWLDKSIGNQKALAKIKLPHCCKIFMEINEYPDIHKYNNSQKYLVQAFKSNIALSFFHKKTIKYLDGIALMTINLEKYFKPLLKKHTEVLHLPMTVDLSRFNFSVPHSNIAGLNHVFTFIGSTNDKKDGLVYLIKAFSRIHQIYPSCKLRIFGFWTYDTQAHLKLIDELGLQEYVLYSKPISSEKVVEQLFDSTVLVLPRPDSYQAKGGFPTKLGEYLATSKPVIATKVGELPLYLNDEESVFFAEPGDEESLFKVMLKVLENYPLALKVGRKGREVAEKDFCVEVQSKRLSKFFDELMGSSISL